MNKAELEQHHTQYYAVLSETRETLQGGDYKKAVDLAVSSWEHIDGMMQYERKYNGRDSVEVEAIDTVLRFAPLLFDFECLNKLDVLLKGQRRIEKNTSADLTNLRAKARELMWEAHRLWNHLEQHPNSRQDELRRSLSGDQDRWRSMAETWEKMGLLSRTPEGGSYRLSLSTRMDEPILAKCPSCAALGKAPKSKFLDDVTCPKCHVNVSFVFFAGDQKVGN
jgi:hypothetical protein